MHNHPPSSSFFMHYDLVSFLTFVEVSDIFAFMRGDAEKVNYFKHKIVHQKVYGHVNDFYWYLMKI